MKRGKGFAVALLALIMTAAMTMAAFAADTTYTISAPATGLAGHTYSVYQLLTGDYAADGKLTNVAEGKNASLASGYTAKTALEALQKIDQSEDDATVLAEIEKIVSVTGDPVATLSGTTTKVSVTGGYYLIKDAITENTQDAQSTSLYIVRVVGDFTITPKSAVPTFEKKIKDINDSTDTTTTDWQDSADYDIGDAVPFQLKGTVAANYDAYQSYKFIFHDVEAKGLTFDASSVKVYVDGSQITSGYEVVTTGLTDGDTFEVKFANLKEISSVKAESVITVEYTSTLNEDANLGKTGNENTANLEFSNNPNAGQKGENDTTDKTPDDTVIVFTYKVVVNKIDKNKKALTGAEFKLEKKLQNGTYKEVAGTVDTAGTVFTFTGIDDGTYRLTETKTPTGYNAIKALEFTVTAEHKVIWTKGEDGEAFTSLTGNANSGLVASGDTGILTADIVNYAGSTLPETGGMGTTFLYVFGAVLVFVAVVVLITRKRVGSK